jgi:hypothetical protein
MEAVIGARIRAELYFLKIVEALRANRSCAAPGGKTRGQDSPQGDISVGQMPIASGGPESKASTADVQPDFGST